MTGLPTVDHGDATEHAVPCFRCGMCCIRWQPLLGPAEIRRLAGELGITARTFKRRYTRPFPLRRGWHQLREGAVGCVFLDVQDGIYGCTIHTIRPEVCRQWQAGLDHRECLEGLRRFPGPPLITVDDLFADATDRRQFVTAVSRGGGKEVS